MGAISFREAYLKHSPDGAMADTTRKRIAAEDLAKSAPEPIRKAASAPERDVFAEIAKRAEALAEKDATLSLDDATAHVLNTDPALYERYRREALKAGRRPLEEEHIGKVSTSSQDAVQAEIDRLADAEVRKSGCDRAEAVRKVLNTDPALYSRYREANTVKR